MYFLGHQRMKRQRLLISINNRLGAGTSAEFFFPRYPSRTIGAILESNEFTVSLIQHACTVRSAVASVPASILKLDRLIAHFN